MDDAPLGSAATRERTGDAARETGQPGAEVHRQAPRILVVDDDPVCCRLMADVLERAGYAVEWTTAATVAMERVAARCCSLVVSDVNMPHMLGTELAAEVAKLDPRLRILLVSAFADRRTQAEARALDAMLLAKPIRAEVLLAAVNALLGAPAQEEAAP